MMRASNHIHKCVLAILFVFTTFAVPATLSISGNETFDLSNDIHCSSTLPFSPFYLTLQACAQSISELLSNQEIGTFHNGRPYDAFSLPVTEIAGRCRVTIQIIQQAATDQTSWMGIYRAATQLNRACASEKGRRYNGGWVTAGDNGRITIQLDWWRGTTGHENTTALMLDGD